MLFRWLPAPILRMLAAAAMCWAVAAPSLALAAPPESNVTALMSYWVDAEGQAQLKDVLALPADALHAMDKPRAFKLARGALWLRYEVPELDPQHQWYLLVEGPSYTNRAFFYQEDAQGQWELQQAGDHLPMSQWTHPDLVPTFRLTAPPGTAVWLRLENFPTSIAPGLSLLNEHRLESRRNNTLLYVGGYLGFGLLVIFLGWVHARLYADRAFVAYMGYVVCMLGFQAYYNGIGAFFFTPEWHWWNDASPAIFVCWLTGFGMWFVREVCALYRYNRAYNRFIMRWSVLGFLYPVVYLLYVSPLTFDLLNLYGLLSVLISVFTYIWAWRKGETYAGWTALGFLPLHLAYPFPALRAAGLLGDTWLTQHALLIGSAIEIPLLLYILHRRAKDFSENRARLRALESTDPLTGLPIMPVLVLRLGDALRRARRNKNACGVALVDLGNHAELVAQEGRPAGDRALVIAASQLKALTRDIDTVCRVDENRFLVLLESPYRPELLKPFAQHIVAKGLVHTPPLPPHVNLRYRVVTIALPDLSFEESTKEEQDVARLIARLGRVLDQLDPKRIVIHLPLQAPAPAPAPAAATKAA